MMRVSRTALSLPILLLVAGLTLPATAYAGDVSGSFRVLASVRPAARMQALEAPGTVRIARDDIRRGWVDVELLRFAVATNDRRGTLLVTDLGGPFSRATFEGGDRVLEVGGGEGWVPLPFAGTEHEYRFRVRLWVGETAVPGEYSWPLGLQIAPLG